MTPLPPAPIAKLLHGPCILHKIYHGSLVFQYQLMHERFLRKKDTQKNAKIFRCTSGISKFVQNNTVQ